MENPTSSTEPKMCINCEQNEAKNGTNFCSKICFELWYSLEQAKVLNGLLEGILNEHFHVKR